MNKIFCSACGHKNIYEVTQPKFCAGCGSQIAGGIGNSLAGVDKVSSPRMEVEVEDEVRSEFDLRKLRSQIVAESNNSVMKLGDIMGSSSSAGGDLKRDASNLPDGDALLEQSRKDCGTSKPTDIDG